VIARAPMFESSFASDLASSDLYCHWKSAPAGSYEGRSMVDGKMRVFSYQAIGGMPLAVVVGIAVEPWKRALSGDVAVAFAALAIAALASWLSGRFALRTFERFARSDDGQRRLNEELRLARDENARGEKRMRTIADGLPALVAYVDAQERYVFNNSYYRTVLGVDADHMKGRTIEEAMGKDVYERIVDQVRLALDGQTVSFERDIKVGDEARAYKFAYTPDLGEDGVVLGFCTMAIDITETKNVQERLRALARFDTLTGLPNRAQLYERLDMALLAGDEALKEFGRRLQSSARRTDLVGRLAGDEFVMVLEGVDSPGAAAVVAKAVIEAMRAPFLIFGLAMTVSTSVGVAVSNAQDQSADDLLKRADAALYSAKRAGRGMFKTSEPPAPGPGEA
jgi:PAS domain S-box-containing protein